MNLLEERICKICGNKANHTSYMAREMMYGLKDEFRYFQCGSCLCLQIEDFPPDISRYYANNYYSFSEYNGGKFKGLWGKIKRIQYAASVLADNSFKRMVRSIFPVKDYSILRGLNINQNTRIIDVGCGNGRSFLYPLSACGYRNVMGCDPFIANTISYQTGLTIQKSNIFEIEGGWDIVTYHHSFEHLPDPLENLRKVHEILNEGGVCIVRIPTVSSFAWEHYRINWGQLDAPRHFFLHSKESMKVLADKAELELYDIFYDSTHFQFSGSEKLLLDVSLRTERKKDLLSFIRRKWKKAGYKRRAKKLNRENRGDQAAFFFRKPSVKS